MHREGKGPHEARRDADADRERERTYRKCPLMLRSIQTYKTTGGIAPWPVHHAVHLRPCVYRDGIN